MTLLNDMFDKGGQSPWMDNIKRSWLKDGTLKSYVDRGIRGVTSNPTIFTKAIEASSDYDEQFFSLVEKGMTVEECYWELVKTDITDALNILDPVYESSNGADGFVSIEVAPTLANDSTKTLEMAKMLSTEISKHNLLVKIPATREGLLPIKEMIKDGRSVNVTLIFSVKRYKEVIDAYLSGLEERVANGVVDLSNVSSVASFFVSRVDTEVDKRLDAIGSDLALSLRGKTAVSQAKLAYELFKEEFYSPRFESLKKYGARLQRPLWASTSTKNPNYDGLIYVNNLIGANTVNTMPDSTVNTFLDHGKVENVIEKDLDLAYKHLQDIKDVGIDIDNVTEQLENEGVESFRGSFEELLGQLENKAKSH